MKEKRMNETCKHNNSIGNNCSDCNEEQLFDNILNATTSELIALLTDTNNIITDLLADYSISNEMKDRIEDSIILKLQHNYKRPKYRY